VGISLWKLFIYSSRSFVNRRLGEFLKELDLTEGRSTGIPTIQEGLQRNGSPRATFETDEDRRVLWVTIPIQPDYFESLDSSDTNQNDISSKQDINDKEIQLLELLEQEPTITLVKAAEKLGWKETLVKYYVASLKKKKMLSRNGTSHNGVWVVSKD